MVQMKILFRKKEKRNWDSLDFFLIKDFSEGLAAAIIESDGKLGAFTFFIWFPSHLPCFLGGFDFFSTGGAFCH